MRSGGPLRVRETSNVSQGRGRHSANVAGHIFSAPAAHVTMGMVGRELRGRAGTSAQLDPCRSVFNTGSACKHKWVRTL